MQTDFVDKHQATNHVARSSAVVVNTHRNMLKLEELFHTYLQRHMYPHDGSMLGHTKSLIHLYHTPIHSVKQGKSIPRPHDTRVFFNMCISCWLLIFLCFSLFSYVSAI